MKMHELPQAVRAYLTPGKRTNGIEPLAGLSGARVWRVRNTNGSRVIKAASPRETAFYTQIAPVLRAQAVPLPHLIDLLHGADTTWLVLEDIPLPLPRTRWLANGEQLAMLRRLHHASLPDQIDPAAWYQPHWNEPLTAAALAWFAPPTAYHLRQTLDPIRLATPPLFTPHTPIGGDPNPTNWGVRADGTLALFDWERFGMASAAIDVAITVPGLPTLAAFETVATAYLQTATAAPPASFTHDLIRAKIWTVIELLATLAERGDPPATLLAYLQHTFPPWLDQMTRVLDRGT